jgi:LysR family transcriptional regulator, low CO2-responsive transcriptional regulator
LNRATYLINIALMGLPPKKIDTRVEAFANHPHVFIASPVNSLVGQLNISPDVLNQYEIISREPGSGTRDIMEIFRTASYFAYCQHANV